MASLLIKMLVFLATMYHIEGCFLIQDQIFSGQMKSSKFLCWPGSCRSRISRYGLGSSCNQLCVSCRSPQERCGGGRPRLLLPPHQILQLPELGPQVGVGGGDGLGDGGVDVGYSWLRSSAEVSISLESADIVPPELCLLGERNVAGVKIQRHS